MLDTTASPTRVSSLQYNLLSFDQVHIRQEQPRVLSPYLYVIVGTIHQTPNAANVLWV